MGFPQLYGVKAGIAVRSLSFEAAKTARLGEQRRCFHISHAFSASQEFGSASMYDLAAGHHLAAEGPHCEAPHGGESYATTQMRNPARGGS